MTEEKESEIPQMHILEHITELRNRLLISILIIAVGSVVAYYMIGDIFGLLSKPYFEFFPKNSLIGTGPAEAFLLRLKLSIFAGIVLTSPALFLQIWLFISPGLMGNEKKLLIPFLIATTGLFLVGIGFCYYVVLPFCFKFFFGQYQSISVTPTIRITEHLSLTAKAMLGFGLIFELPVLSFFLARIGLITHRTLIKWARHAIVLIFIVGAILTPPDVLTQILMAGPLIVLYGISIVIAWLVHKNKS